MRFIVPLFVACVAIASVASGDDLSDAKQEYLRARRTAAKQLYDSYKKAIADAKAKGSTAQAEQLDKEMRAFVQLELDALKPNSIAKGFDLLAVIQQADIDFDEGKKLTTEVQRKNAMDQVVERLTKQISDKPYSADFVITEVESTRDTGSIVIKFAPPPALAELIGKKNCDFLMSYPMRLSQREANKIVPGDLLRLRGKLQGVRNGSRRGDAGVRLVYLPLPDTTGYDIVLLSSRANIVRQMADSPPADLEKTDAGQIADGLTTDVLEDDELFLDPSKPTFPKLSHQPSPGVEVQGKKTSSPKVNRTSTGKKDKQQYTEFGQVKLTPEEIAKFVAQCRENKALSLQVVQSYFGRRATEMTPAEINESKALFKFLSQDNVLVAPRSANDPVFKAIGGGEQLTQAFGVASTLEIIDRNSAYVSLSNVGDRVILEGVDTRKLPVGSWNSYFLLKVAGTRKVPGIVGDYEVPVFQAVSNEGFPKDVIIW
jgi:hypothetical protein